jgi:ATP-dependent DNA helicase RecQ
LKISQNILQKYWGYQGFRPRQEEIVDDSINGYDVLALLPTGGGKSICFQVPGLVREGITIVISPLIALMQDQVQNLEKIGIRAKAITSGMSFREIDIILDNARFGGLDFLYTSPERIQSKLFIERFKLMQVGLIVVDEAHCISEWGHDFRPSFQQIYRLREFHPSTPILALTATATEKVRQDIIFQLKLKNTRTHEASFQRNNLAYQVLKTSNKLERILSFCKVKKDVGIIYCQTRKSVKALAKTFIANGINCGIYHGGLNSVERISMLQSWMREEIPIMIATNAFGMGIDKPNVRFVLHYEIPPSLEAYFQEAGRGGRDGNESVAIAFIEKNDLENLNDSISEKYPEKSKIKDTYRAICNFLKIAIGSGKDETYPIDLKLFCKLYQLDYTETYHSLKILELNENLVFSESVFQPTKVLFLVDNVQLYNFQIQHEKFYQLTSLLTRSYSGIFDSFQNIHENEIAKRLSISLAELEEFLKALEKYGIIEVTWRNSLPTVTFVQERIPDDYFSLNPTIYLERRQNALDKLNKIIDFVELDKCRAQQVIAYFGQHSEPCGKCDVCLKQNNAIELNEPNLLKYLDDWKSIFELCDAFQVNENNLKPILRKIYLEEKITFENGRFIRK